MTETLPRPKRPEFSATAVKSVVRGRENILLLLVLTAAYCAVVTIVNPGFFSLATLFDLIRSGAAGSIVALGVLVVMISGGIDVSFLANAIFSAYVATALAVAYDIDSLSFMVVVSIGVGTIIGAVNGLIIYFFALPTLITTLAMQGLLQGILMVLLKAGPITANFMPQSLIDFGSATLFDLPSGDGGWIGLSMFAVPLAVVIALSWYLLRRTPLGRSVYALGSNAVSARRCGIDLLRVNLFVYVYAGALAGLMGLMMVADIRVVNPVSLVGDELFILAAVVIGGAKLTGGSGTIGGVLLGMTLITLLNNTLVTLGLSASWNKFFVGATLVLIASISHYRSKVEALKKLNFENI